LIFFYSVSRCYLFCLSCFKNVSFRSSRARLYR